MVTMITSKGLRLGVEFLSLRSAYLSLRIGG